MKASPIVAMTVGQPRRSNKSVFDNPHAALGMIRDPIGGVAQQAAPQLRSGRCVRSRSNRSALHRRTSESSWPDGPGEFRIGWIIRSSLRAVLISRRFEWTEYVVMDTVPQEEAWIAVIVCGPLGRCFSRARAHRPNVNHVRQQRLIKGVRRCRKALTIVGRLGRNPKSVFVDNGHANDQVIRKPRLFRAGPSKRRLQCPNRR